MGEIFGGRKLKSMKTGVSEYEKVDRQEAGNLSNFRVLTKVAIQTVGERVVLKEYPLQCSLQANGLYPWAKGILAVAQAVTDSRVT